MEDQGVYYYLDQNNEHKLRRKKPKPLNGMQTVFVDTAKLLLFISQFETD